MAGPHGSYRTRESSGAPDKPFSVLRVVQPNSIDEVEQISLWERCKLMMVEIYERTITEKDVHILQIAADAIELGRIVEMNQIFAEVLGPRWSDGKWWLEQRSLTYDCGISRVRYVGRDFGSSAFADGDIDGSGPSKRLRRMRWFLKDAKNESPTMKLDKPIIVDITNTSNKWKIVKVDFVLG